MSPTNPSSGPVVPGLDEAGVLAGHADGERAVDVDGGHDVAVHLAHKDHPGDVERLGIGDPEPVAELGFLAEPFHQLADLGPAAVDHHGTHADRAHEDDVVANSASAASSPRLPRSVPAVLDHDDLVPEPPDIRQRLDQDLRLGAGASVDVPVRGWSASTRS